MNHYIICISSPNNEIKFRAMTANDAYFEYGETVNTVYGPVALCRVVNQFFQVADKNGDYKRTKMFSSYKDADLFLLSMMEEDNPDVTAFTYVSQAIHYLKELAEDESINLPNALLSLEMAIEDLEEKQNGKT